MADLSQLYKVAPNAAAFMTGQQQGNDNSESQLNQQKLAQLIQDLQQAHAQADQMNPLLVQQQVGVNAARDAQLPGLQATSRSLGQTADIGEATMPSTIAAKNADNTNDVLNKHIAGANAVTKFLTDTAGQLDQVPPPARAGALRGMLSRANLDPNDPAVAPLMKVLNNVPADHLPLALTHIADTLNQHSAAYTQAMDVEKEKTRSAAATNAATNATTIQHATIAAEASKYVANKNAESRIQVAKDKAKGAATDVWQSVLAGKMKPELAAAALEHQASNPMLTPEEQAALREEARKISTFVLSLRNQAKPGTVDPSAASGLPAAPPAENPYNGGPKRGAGTAADPIVLK